MDRYEDPPAIVVAATVKEFNRLVTKYGVPPGALHAKVGCALYGERVNLIIREAPVGAISGHEPQWTELSLLTCLSRDGKLIQD